MRTIKYLLLAALVLGLCASSWAQDSGPMSGRMLTKDEQARALQVLKKEKQVKSAAWDEKGLPSLLVGVQDDGSARTGFAEYLCMELGDAGIRGALIQVVDHTKGFGVERKILGIGRCSK